MVFIYGPSCSAPLSSGFWATCVDILLECHQTFVSMCCFISQCLGAHHLGVFLVEVVCASLWPLACTPYISPSVVTCIVVAFTTHLKILGGGMQCFLTYSPLIIKIKHIHNDICTQHQFLFDLTIKVTSYPCS